ncbi:hypothetical protein ASC77_02745 [Nocardioides sp. Root1257]|uniref:helix-turn-helix transcriptional regulator n=1 Tax=unclassified Nocardioides TaxID=2615069 RepID=UPI0007008BF9|nr:MULTISPECIES: LuxR family transcriptional regulator [unclassified Nocardioides]KQW53229.1 hypothetical protein ASC77_02745 [Nocardioides sp. Root1257]KRC55916.1 hypothetical protein ASE24_02745 [Nocardioides sp. Root224]
MDGQEPGAWSGARDGLVGRDETLATLRDLLDQSHRTAVVTGIPGAGKTSVLTVLARAEAAEGRLVLSLTCHASERHLAFGVLVDLLSRAPGAEDVLDLVLPGTTGAVDPLRLRLAVLGWLEELAEERPVVVIVDDAQWCDDSSLSVLGFVAHRIAGSDVSVIASARGTTAPDPLLGHPQVVLPPLSDRDARFLLRQAGLLIDALTLPSVIDRAAGNPLALLELGRAATSDGSFDAVPSSVEAAFGEQVALLPAATRDVLLLASTGDGDLRVLGRIVEPDRLLDDLAPAEDAGLVSVVDHVVRFRHPLVRAAALSSASTSARLSAHARLASSYDDPERSAWHRAEATLVPDADVAAALVVASDLAQRRGASAESARMMARAAELSVDRADREERLLQAAQINSWAGDFAWTARIGTQLRTETDDPEIRVRAGHIAAYALAQTQESSAARRALTEVLGELVEAAPFWGWSSLTTLAVLTYRAGWDVAEVAEWLGALERAQESAQADFPAIVPAAQAWIRLQIDPTSRPPGIVELVRDAPVPDYPLEVSATHEMLLGAAGWLLDEPALATERLNRSIELMRRADAPGAMTQTLIALALVKFTVGDYDAVDQAGRLVLDIGEARNQLYAIVDGYELQARAAAIRGDVERARELCDRVLLEIPVGEALALEVTVRVTLSWLRLAAQDVQGAWHEVRWIFHDDGEPRHRHICYRELGYYAATAVRAGATDELARVLAVAERVLVDPRPYHRLELARARALAAGEDAEPWHRRAVEDPAAGQWPFELANAQLEYGAWLRRRHRQTEARLQLQSALDTFTRLGTRAWAEMARSELRAAGVATGAPEASAWADLTGQEREVVRLAASGKTNPEIAATLYLSPRTVSTHLYNAFPKLGVTSRGQLRDVVPDPT